jgi:rubrerythrin
MEPCDACKALQGQGVDTEPHATLACDDTHLRSDGTLEIYRCRECGTRWERHNAPPQAMPGAKNPVWRRA